MKHAPRLAAVLLLALALVPPAAARAQASSFTTELTPEARASWDLAQRAFIAGEFLAGRKALDRLMELAPEFPYAPQYFAFGRQPAEIAAAAEKYRKLAEAAPGRAPLWYAYGRLEQDRAKREAAFKKVVELEPGAPWGYLGLGYVARVAGENDKALPLYEKAYALAPKEPAAVSAVAVVYSAVPGRMADAVKRLDELMAVAPRTTPAHGAFQSIFYATEVGADRAALAERYIKTYPAGALLGDAYLAALDEQKKKDPAGAAARARAAIAASKPEDKDLYPAAERRPLLYEHSQAALLGVVLDEAAPRGKAALDAIAAGYLADAHAGPTFLQSLGRGYTERGGEAATSVKIFEAALARLPKDPAEDMAETADAIRLDLGRAYLASGDAARAVEALVAVKADDLVAPASAVLGEAYTKVGDPAKAYAAIVRAVAVEPSAKYEKMLAEAAAASGKTKEAAESEVWALRDASARPASDFTLTSLEGKPVSLASYRGKVVLLNFWFPG
jgi:Tfp pilus assembly protein PilF